MTTCVSTSTLKLICWNRAKVRAEAQNFFELLQSPYRRPIEHVHAWIQRTIELPPHSRGFHLITQEVLAALPELEQIETGLLHVFMQHTSASLTINENADPDVPADLESSFSSIAPEDFPYRHTCEGPDDMPAHVEGVAIGQQPDEFRSPRVLICLGTWQGIYLCEHRNRGGRRRLVLTLWGEA